MKLNLFVVLCCVSFMTATSQKVVSYTFDIRDWVVDFMRPTYSDSNLKRKSPFDIPDENRKSALLANGVYPGPLIEAYENDTIEVNVVNNMLTEGTTIHWHGIHPVDTPWMDGALGVSQAAITSGNNFTYRFRAWPAGTHYWHSHMDSVQGAKGLRGPIVVHKRDDPVKKAFNYDEDLILVLSDEWKDPDVCLKLEGAIPGNDVCSDSDYASMNGVIMPGDTQTKFDKSYPYPNLNVEKGKCYRLRIMMVASNAENYIFSMDGHNMTLVSLDGVDVDPLPITSINMHIGERADVIFCADQDPGYYKMEFKYDYACTLEPGHFIPPGFHPVKACAFYGMLHYANEREFPFYSAPSVPGKTMSKGHGTGGGAKPKPKVGVPFDLTNPGDWNKTKPVEAMPEPEEPDVRYNITLGLLGPTYSVGDQPLSKGRWYMDIDGRRWSWTKPRTPLLHTKGGQCGADNVPVLNIPEDAKTVELVINNLSPNAHNLHMHGLLFQVINVANFEWCNINKTACFVMPEFANPCPRADRGYGDENHKLSELNFYWGCKYNAEKDKPKQNLQTPLRKDSFEIWQRSWAVIRFKADKPGVWPLHCHMNNHLPLGMVMALNIQPSKQKKVPADVPTENPC